MSLPKFSVNNRVLVNLIMVVLLVTGSIFAATTVREMFPESRPDQIIISAVYPATQPEELEKAVTIKIEEVVRDIEGVEKVSSTVREGFSTTLLTLYNEVDDIDAVLQEVKNEIDALEDIPDDLEKITIRKLEPTIPVIQIALFGEGSEADRKQAARDLKDELLRLPGISEIQLGGIREDEISIEILPEKLWSYNITFSEVADAVRKTNRDVSGGTLKGDTSSISVKTQGEEIYAKELGDIVIRSDNDGGLIRLEDVATIKDGFVDVDLESYFNGLPSISLVIQKTSSQDSIHIANMVMAYVKGKQGKPYETDTPQSENSGFLTSAYQVVAGKIYQSYRFVFDRFTNEPLYKKIYEESRANPFPHSFKVQTFSDLSQFIRGRLDLMLRNAQSGLILVLIALNLFLNWRVAFWVAMGMPVSFIGGFIILAYFGVTLNLLSMFGLIIVLGIIVDDAIVIGENIWTHIERGEDPMTAAVVGAEEVMWPVIVSVMTNISSFIPLLFISGRIGEFFRELPIVVLAVLSISLLEALLILPAHLCHLPRRPSPEELKRRQAELKSGWRMNLQYIANFYEKFFMEGIYMKLMRTCLHWRYATIAVVFSTLLLTLGMVGGGIVPFVFIQKLDAETIVAELEMPVGTVIAETKNRLMELTAFTRSLPEVRSVQTLVGSKVNIGGTGSMGGETQSHVGQLIVELVESDVREDTKQRSSEQLLSALRDYSVTLKGINSVQWEAFSGGPAGKDVEIRLSGNNFNELVESSILIKQELGKYDGVVDLKDDYELGKREIQFELKESARSLGITENDLGTFIRNSLFGAEARRVTRNREDIKIMVRYPSEYRKNIHNLEEMWVPLPASIVADSSSNGTMPASTAAATSGRWVPVNELATWKENRTFTTLHRSQQFRSISISADVDYTKNNLDNIMQNFRNNTVVELKQKYPSLQLEFLGTAEERDKSFAGLYKALPIALLLIYMQLAGLFRSYLQPLVVMMAIPFGLEGAILGHWFFGQSVTILSCIGMVALTGILVNDAVVMMDFINNKIIQGADVMQAHIESTKLRLRAIMLTTITTVAGILPLIFERSFQAKFLIPMAVTIACGLMFATIITLVVIPSLNLICYDMGLIYREKTLPEGNEVHV